ncbi:hypothetical protein GCM10022286_00920 [Gryllotalpicola daejeonensis]|uniref:Type I restriction modification DNA specificity domain-containing protein n=1 Tax=Gryllotalpicola daejeonensis TaxID=993087 RepID=A0ABP7ZGJ7_9MICO
MREGWMTVRVRDFCTITKGTTPTLKAVPGPYPLVVTGEEFASSADYQLEGEAVCVPLVSSTGHGHASLKRVHYASGKFAVANIIAAVQVKDSARYSTKYLHLVLSHFRNELLVSRMKGTANVSLSISAIADVEVALPPISEQRRIVDLIAAVDDAIEAAAEERRAATESLVAISESLWDVPERAQIRTLGDLFTGETPASSNPANWTPEDVPFITPGDVDRLGTEVQSTSRKVSTSAAKASKRTLRGHAVLQVCIGATIGKVGTHHGEALYNQQINAVSLGTRFDAVFLASAMSSPTFQSRLKGRAGKTTMPIVSKSAWGVMEVPWPGHERRNSVGSSLESHKSMLQSAETTVSALRALRAELLTACLSGDHEIPASYDALLEA